MCVCMCVCVCVSARARGGRGLRVSTIQLFFNITSSKYLLIFFLFTGVVEGWKEEGVGGG